MAQNRYTRLKAIKVFGYDITWDDLKRYYIGIVGFRVLKFKLRRLAN